MGDSKARRGTGDLLLLVYLFFLSVSPQQQDHTLAGIGVVNGSHLPFAGTLLQVLGVLQRMLSFQRFGSQFHKVSPGL